MTFILRASLSSFIFLCSPSLWSATPALSKTDTQKSKKEASCTVDGHGPYDLNFSKCLKLGSDQAHTNCVLKEKDSKVDVQFSFAKKKKLAACFAKRKVGTEDCHEAQCSMLNDTPQH